ncbi:hypothetical protein KCU78_g14412, partial [Aureobasidium melanogenum]
MSLDPKQQAIPEPQPGTEPTDVPRRQETHANPAPTLAWIQSRVHDIYSAAKHLPPDSKSVNISMNAYTKIYTAIFDYVTSGKPRSAHLPGEDLYRILEREIGGYCSDIHYKIFPRETQGNAMDENAAGRLLTAYTVQWERFIKLTKFVRNLFHFMERHWVKREIDEKNKNVHTIENLHKKLWKEEALQIQKDELSSQELQALTAAAMILREKAGGTTAEETDLIESFFKSLSWIGLSIDGCLQAT